MFGQTYIATALSPGRYIGLLDIIKWKFLRSDGCLERTFFHSWLRGA